MLERGWLNDMPFPERQPRRDGAARAEIGGAIGDVERSAAAEADRILIAALPAARAGRKRVVTHAGAAQQRLALVALAPQLGELTTGERADRAGEIKLGPGQVLGMIAAIAVEQHPAKAEQRQDEQGLDGSEGAHLPRTRQRGLRLQPQVRRAVAASSAVTG